MQYGAFKDVNGAVQETVVDVGTCCCTYSKGVTPSFESCYCPPNHSLDWWFSWEVQDFVALVLRDGGHIVHRWVDVATQSMIGHLFCPEENFHVFKDIHIEHGRGPLCTTCGAGWIDELQKVSPSPPPEQSPPLPDAEPPPV